MLTKITLDGAVMRNKLRGQLVNQIARMKLTEEAEGLDLENDLARALEVFPERGAGHGRTMGRLRARNGKDRSMNRDKPADVEVVSSSFGGGWIIPLTPAGSMALMEFFDEEPAELVPLYGRAGYIVEPFQGGELVEHLRGADLTWKAG